MVAIPVSKSLLSWKCSQLISMNAYLGSLHYIRLIRRPMNQLYNNSVKALKESVGVQESVGNKQV